MHTKEYFCVLFDECRITFFVPLPLCWVLIVMGFQGFGCFIPQEFSYFFLWLNSPALNRQPFFLLGFWYIKNQITEYLKHHYRVLMKRGLPSYTYVYVHVFICRDQKVQHVLLKFKSQVAYFDNTIEFVSIDLKQGNL